MTPKYFATLLLAATTLTVTLAAARPGKDPLSIQITTPGTTVAVGSPIRVDIVAENVSKNPIPVAQRVAADQAELDYEVIVRTLDGGELKETPWGRRLHGKDPDNDAYSGWSIFSYNLLPGKMMKGTTYIDKIYNLTIPGRYAIRVERIGSDHRVIGRSNVLHITIVK